ncbi:MAG: carbamoyltransferase HypF, partial [Candidatus Aenigmarchaeota archaeon]|nr:carbamoyltransferase HypF [Candidatus Aenigmarchaeota archaeon]
CDMHSNYYTTQYAKEISENIGAKLVLVQHHLAHVYSVALENNFSSFVGISCDGSGYGSDETVWGGEVFLCDSKKKVDGVRVGHLEEQILIGRELAIKEPIRILYGIFSKFLSKKECMSFFGDRIDIWEKQIHDNFNVVSTTSCGRILDAASYFLGVCKKRTYSGEPAISLESFADGAKPYDFDVVIEKDDSGVLILKTTPLFEFLWKNKDKDKRRLAATVQDYLARGFLEIAKSVSGDLPIVFSGGVAYNKYITKFMIENGVIVNSKVPCGDGGISFGQIGYFLNNYMH